MTALNPYEFVSSRPRGMDFLKEQKPRTVPRSRKLRIEFLEDRLLCASGALDLSFNKTGKQTVQIGSSGGSGSGLQLNDVADAVAVQPDNKIILAGTTRPALGTNFAVTRLNVDGSLDTGFGKGGTTTIPVFVPNAFDTFTLNNVTGIALQGDGGIVIVGSAADSGPYDFAAVRLTANGQLDPTFGTGGIVTIAFASSAQANAVAIAPDTGDIVIAGEVSSPLSPTFKQQFAVARLTPAGVLDPSFGNAGEQVFSFSADGSTQDEANAVAVTPHGAVVLAGSTTTNSTTMAAVAQLTSSGTLDSTFGNGGGLQTLSFVSGSSNDFANGVALQQDGGIVVAGSANGYGFGVARLNSLGHFDTTFNGYSANDIQFSGTSGNLKAAANAVVIDSSGGVLLAGVVNSGGTASNDFAVARVQSNGTVDSSFGVGGYTIIPFDLGGSSVYKNDDRAYAMATTSDSKVVIAGSATPKLTTYDFATVFAVARLIVSPPGTTTGPTTPTNPTTPITTHPAPVVPVVKNPVFHSPPVRVETPGSASANPAVSAAPQLAGTLSTAPRILYERVLRGRRGVRGIVVRFNQTIVRSKFLNRSTFALYQSAAGGSLGRSVSIAKMTYNRAFHTMTLTFAPHQSIHGSYTLIVHSAGIVNDNGQSLDGNGDGVDGDDLAVPITF